jgi:hypothetical protein
VELGFEKIPFIFIDQVLQEDYTLSDILDKVWEYTCSVLTYNKVKNNIVIYRKTDNGGVPMLELSVKNDFSQLVDALNYIFVEVHSKIVDENKNIVESANFHVIIYKNAESQCVKRIDKKLFQGELE